MPMNTLRTALLALVVAAAFRAAAQPVYTFRVKVGIDRESVDSLGGRDRVGATGRRSVPARQPCFQLRGAAACGLRFRGGLGRLLHLRRRVGRPDPQAPSRPRLSGGDGRLQIRSPRRRAAAGTATGSRPSTIRARTTTVSTARSRRTPSTASSTSSAMRGASPTSMP